MNSLFDINENLAYQPLADKMRPKTLDEFYGQVKLVGKNSPIRTMIEEDKVTSMIFWGPPGVGKTTLAHIIANETNSAFYELSAVTSGVKEIKEIIELAKFNNSNNRKTILFVDEIHRFNKAQQDAFLPYVEKGVIILIGATTENPSFEVNSALLSRTKVYVLESLSVEDLNKVLKNALDKIESYKNVVISDPCIEYISSIASGDARGALNTLENVISLAKQKNSKRTITKELITKSLDEKMTLYDKNGENHYNLISALHKSMRNSDPDAALYYLARMLEGGEDPLYIARRLIRFASEDVGLANPSALSIAVSSYEASHYIGVPECNVNLAQAVVYLSVSPKSNSLYTAYSKAREDAVSTMNEGVPLHLRNAVTKLDASLGNGKGYKYAHDFEDKITNMECLPKKLRGHVYYEPCGIGKEKDIKEVLERIKRIKKSNPDN